MPSVNISLDIFGIIVMLIIFLSCLEERLKKETKSNIFLVMMGAVLCALIADMLSWIGEGRPSLAALTIISNTVASCMGYVSIFCFIVYMWQNLFRNSKAVKVIVYIFGAMCILSAVLISINAYHGVSFLVDAHGHYVHSNDFFVMLVHFQFPVLSVIATVLMLFSTKDVSLRTKSFYFLYIIFPVLGVVLDYAIHGLSLTYIGMVVSVMIIYTNIYLQKRTLISEQKTALMMSQINPHFMYNTLSAIAALCDIEPKKAKALTIEFSTYLRQNIETLSTTELIPFEQELRHVECYLKIEKARFKDKVKFDYSVQTENFYLPALTVQPLVENAVRHGITKKSGGGTVKLTTYQTENSYFVEIKDDGVGFDTEAAPSDERKHIGIENVRNRLKDMCGGTMEIKSMVGVGTRVTVEIPKKKGGRR